MLGGLLKNRFSTSGQAPYRLLLLSKSDPLRWAPDLVLGVEFNTGASKVFAPANCIRVGVLNVLLDWAMLLPSFYP